MRHSDEWNRYDVCVCVCFGPVQVKFWFSSLQYTDWPVKYVQHAQDMRETNYKWSVYNVPKIGEKINNISEIYC